MNRIEKIIENTVQNFQARYGGNWPFPKLQIEAAIREAVRPLWEKKRKTDFVLGTYGKLQSIEYEIDEFAPLFAEEKPTLRSGVPKTEEPKHVQLPILEYECGCRCSPDHQWWYEVCGTADCRRPK